MQYKLRITLAVLCLITSNEALRVLVVFPMMSKSHSILGHGFADRLAEAGHEVVHITSFPKGKPVPNLKELDVSPFGAEFMEKSAKSGDFDLKNLISQGNFGDNMIFLFFTYIVHKQFLEYPKVVELFSDPNEKFDAVIAEWFFSEITAGIGPLFQCPHIWFASTEPHWQVLRLIDEIPNPAYSVDIFAEEKPPLSFLDRTAQMYRIIKKSAALSILSLFEWNVYNSVYTKMAEKRGVTMPSYFDAVYNGSLMFVNSHPSIGSAFRLPQNAINIGGYHITDKAQPLPKDLQNLLDGAKHGVIYFSMGSNIKSTGMSDEMKQDLLNIFGKLKQTVLWKYEAELEKVPSNVHLIKWAPQPSILAHSNLKFFITHGGQLSTTEALYYGVPVIGLPIGADQKLNMKAIENKGYGIKVTLTEDMGDDLEVAIQEMLANNKYKLKAKELSFIYHNRTLPPGAEMVHWVQHVVATRGAPHLRSPALHVPLYQKLFLDLFAVVIVIILVIRVILRKVLKWRSVKTQKKKEKKN